MVVLSACCVLLLKKLLRTLVKAARQTVGSAAVRFCSKTEWAQVCSCTGQGAREREWCRWNINQEDISGYGQGSDKTACKTLAKAEKVMRHQEGWWRTRTRH